VADVAEDAAEEDEDALGEGDGSENIAGVDSWPDLSGKSAAVPQTCSIGLSSACAR
jgi:hypothetical protein